ncbi:MAG TPA: site-specific integrase [Streptosporangiaceae bacterium]|jgi:integrase
MASIAKRPDGRWRARYRDAAGKEHARHFPRKIDARQWLDTETSKLVQGTWTHPKAAKTTVSEWCDTWLKGYGTRRASTVRQARVHIAQIKAEFGDHPLLSVRPSQVNSWTARLAAEGKSASYIYALHSRLAQIYADAVIDGIVPRSPCSRKTSPGQGAQRTYVATIEQVLALQAALPGQLRAAVLLGAFAGLRCAEACGLRPGDVDYMRGIITPAVQYPAQELKTEISRTPVPVPQDIVLNLAEQARCWPGATVLTDPRHGGQLGPWVLERAIRAARAAVRSCSSCGLVQVHGGGRFRCTGCGQRKDEPGLPAGFRFHDLRHFYASLLIARGEDVKKVQARLRHASAKTTLDTYGHLWPDGDDTTRAAVSSVLSAHPGFCGLLADQNDHLEQDRQARGVR